MSEITKLHDKDPYISFILEDGVARVEFRSDAPLPGRDDLILVVNGVAIAIDYTTPHTATGVLGEWSKFDSEVELMTRVDEYFDGWVFEP